MGATNSSWRKYARARRGRLSSSRPVRYTLMGDELKLRTNVPLLGTVQQVAYFKGKDWADPNEGGKIKRLPDSLRLRGLFGEQGQTPRDTVVFLNVALLGEMLNIGLLRQEPGENSYGCPFYTVLNTTRTLRILKTEDGKKKPIFVSWADAGQPELAAATTGQAAGGATGPRSTPSTPAQANTPAERRPASPVPGPAPTDEQKLEKIRKAHRRRLAQIAEMTGCAWDLAKVEIDAFLERIGATRAGMPTAVYFDMIARFAASVNIQAERENLDVRRKPKTPSQGRSPATSAGAQGHEVPPPAPLPPGIPTEDPYTKQPVQGLQPAKAGKDLSLDAFDDFPEALNGEGEDDLPF